MEIVLIAAVSENGIIGKDGKIPWNIEGEKNHFRELTLGNILIMGRKTYNEIYDGIQKPLPGRVTVVVSARAAESFKEKSDDRKKYDFKNCFTAVDPKEALATARTIAEENLKNASQLHEEGLPVLNKIPKIFIAGGALLYRYFLPYSDIICLTKIHASYTGDVFFPEFDESRYRRTVLKNMYGTDRNTGTSVDFSYIKLERL